MGQGALQVWGVRLGPQDCPPPAAPRAPWWVAPQPLHAEAAWPDQNRRSASSRAGPRPRGRTSPTRGPDSGPASPLPPLEPCFLPCVGVHLPEAESPRHWGLGPGLEGAAPQGEAALTPPAPTDPQPQPQRHLPDELPGRVQGDGGPGRVPEAGQVPGGHHVHGGRGRAEGERHLLGHVHALVW